MTELDHIHDAAQDGLFDISNWQSIPYNWYKTLRESGDIPPPEQSGFWNLYDIVAGWEIEQEQDPQRKAELQRMERNGLAWESARKNTHKRLILKWLQDNAPQPEKESESQSEANTQSKSFAFPGSDFNTQNSDYSFSQSQTEQGYTGTDGSEPCNGIN